MDVSAAATTAFAVRRPVLETVSLSWTELARRFFLALFPAILFLLALASFFPCGYRKLALWVAEDEGLGETRVLASRSVDRLVRSNLNPPPAIRVLTVTAAQYPAVAIRRVSVRWGSSAACILLDFPGARCRINSRARFFHTSGRTGSFETARPAHGQMSGASIAS
jgi:hypothetical protein